MRKPILLIASLLTLAAQSARADEGMYLLNNPPAAAIKSTYGFEVTPTFLEHMQKSSVRFATGGSGSVISKDGLVMTNHHVGSDMLLKLSTKENNLLDKGFWAKTRAEERQCPDLILDILWEIEDVTDRVNAAAKDADDDAAAGAARRKMATTIEAESKDKTKLKSQVVTLYQGGQYHLYRYKSYTDVRLVFAPEEKAAFFGGDTDNFEFPRFNLDCCFFRIYENGQPIKAEHHLSWSAAGAAENDLIFVFGHPGKTRRLYTVDHLKFLRDMQLPLTLQNLWRSEVKFQGFIGRSAENARIAREELAGIANGRKAYTGLLAGLQDPALMQKKMDAEKTLRAKVNADKVSFAKYGEAWDNITNAQEQYYELYDMKSVVDGIVARSTLLHAAMSIVRLAQELPKPSGERLPEYSESRLEDLYFRLYSPEPIHDALEVEILTQQLSRLVEHFGGDDDLVSNVLAGKSAKARAAELVAGCTFKDPANRKALVTGGTTALDAARDPLLALAKLLDTDQRELRRVYEDTIESVERINYAKIAAAKFAAEGDKVYPDATFTLRLSYGSVKAQGDAPNAIPAFTNLAGMFDRAAERKGQPEFDLPPSWIAKKHAINLNTPFNFICTADIIGGNSGSPVVNKAGEVVGLIFDGNLNSLVGDVVFDSVNSRAVAVDSRAMIEAIRNIYNANELADEMLAK